MSNQVQVEMFGPWAEGRSRVGVLVIVNERAGSVGIDGRTKLLTLLKTLQVDAIKTVSDLDELCADNAENADLIVVLGGDGTAARAAATFSTGPPLVLLPGGTRNLLPHALYGQVAWPQALEAALKHGRVTTLTGGEANGRKFFVAAMFGATTLLARAREDARRGRFDLMVSRLKQVFHLLLARKLAVRVLGDVSSRAEAVGVLCPAYRGDTESEALEWVRLNAPSLLDFLRVSVRSVVGGWRGDSSIDVSLSPSGEIRAVRAIEAVLDGEPASFGAHVRVRILPNGPAVLVTTAR